MNSVKSQRRLWTTLDPEILSSVASRRRMHFALRALMLSPLTSKLLKINNTLSNGLPGHQRHKRQSLLGFVLQRLGVWYASSSCAGLQSKLPMESTYIPWWHRWCLRRQKLEEMHGRRLSCAGGWPAAPCFALAFHLRQMWLKLCTPFPAQALADPPLLELQHTHKYKQTTKPWILPNTLFDSIPEMFQRMLKWMQHSSSSPRSSCLPAFVSFPLPELESPVCSQIPKVTLRECQGAQLWLTMWTKG